MAVVSCTLQHTGRSAEITAEAGAFSYTLQYLVRTDDPTDDAREVLDGYLLAGPDPGPDWMANYVRSNGQVDPSSFARRFRPSQPNANTPTLWQVDVDYTPLPKGQDPTFTETPLNVDEVGEYPDSYPVVDNQGLYTTPPAGATAAYTPLREPPVYGLELMTVPQIVEQDYAGNPIVTPAGRPFDEPCEDEADYEVHRVTMNFATYGEIRALNRRFARRTNSDTFLGYPPGHCLCRPIVAGERQFSAGITYVPATFRVICANKPWRREFVARGYEHYVDVDEGGSTVRKLVMATDPVAKADGTPGDPVPVSEPVLLSTGAFQATATASGAILDSDLTGNITGFSPVMPTDPPATGEPAVPTPATPAFVINPLGIAVADGATMLLRKMGGAWGIVQTPAPGSIDVPPKPGYRLPLGQLGHTSDFTLRAPTNFTGAKGLPFATGISGAPSIPV